MGTLRSHLTLVTISQIMITRFTKFQAIKLTEFVFDPNSLISKVMSLISIKRYLVTTFTFTADPPMSKIVIKIGS